MSGNLRESRLLSTILVLAGSVVLGADDPEPIGLKLSDPVALTKQAEGYRDYEELDPVERKNGQTLWIYVEPTNHTIQKVDDLYETHLVEDVEVRRAGQERAVWSKKSLIDYHPTGPERLTSIYLLSSIELEGLKPGHYEAEVIVHDRLKESETARATLKFKIVDGDDDRR